jgi:DNA-binding CsgD family transcriptional regulator
MAGGNEQRVGGPTNGYASLTGRERQIHACLGRGLSDQEIAASLGVELSTVKSHVRHILRKLGVRSRHQAAEIHE